MDLEGGVAAKHRPMIIRHPGADRRCAVGAGGRSLRTEELLTSPVMRRGATAPGDESPQPVAVLPGSHHPPGSRPEPEFDHYADGYSAGCESRLKRLIGSSARVYLEVKADHLLRTLARMQTSAENPRLRLLDFGCGAGDFLSVLRDRSVAWSMEGCDVSSGMLRTARERHPELSPEVPLWNCAEVPLPASTYDLITVVCVLHHVPRQSLRDTLRQLWDALSPGGLLCVYEHNPWNPVTRFMVARAPIDQNAVLISGATLSSHTGAVAAAKPELSNLLFFPPRFRFARRVEAALERIPLGGQYLMMARKSA